MATVRSGKLHAARARLLLSGAALVCACSPARADVPFAAATQAKIEWSAVGDGLFCSPLTPDKDTSGALALNVCPQREASRGVKFGYSGAPTAYGTLDLRAGMAEQATTGALTVERLIEGQAFAQKNVGLTVGATTRLLDNRLTLSSDFAWSRDEITLGDGLGGGERLGAGRWHRAEATLLDGTALKWTASAEFSVVDRDYAANFNARPQGAAMLPGERVALTTSVKLPDMTLSLSSDSTDGPYGARATERVKAAFDGLMLSLSAKRSAYEFVYGGTAFTSTADGISASLEAQPETLFPALLDGAGVAAPLVPVSLSLTFARSTFTNGGAPGTRASFEAMADWTGTWGDTTALYWREAKMQSSGESVSQLLDISHTVRWGNWRAGGGVFVTDTGAAGANGGDVSVMGNLLLAYEVAGGPKFKLRAGYERDDSGDEGFAYSRTASDVMFSLDLSNYVRKELNRPEAHLTVDFRKKLDQSVETLAAEDWPERSVRKQDADGLLVSFGTRF